ncbi:TIGR03790 family protein [Thermodesulfobacteriota bacterium]
MKPSLSFLLIILAFLFSRNCYSLTPDEIVVVVNKNSWHSIDLGKYYMGKRGLPDKNILRLWTTDKETVSREDYEKQIAKPVKKFLAGKSGEGRGIKCLVLMFDIPLKISPPDFPKEEQRKFEDLQKQRKNLQKSLSKIEKENPEHEALTNELKEVAVDIKKMNDSRNSKGASLESELSLIQVPEYSLDGWISNPLFIPFQKKLLPVKPDSIILVSRLDGPDKETVKRMIDDAIATEEKGLKGKAYFDAQWKAPSEEKVKKLEGYGYYDWSIHQATTFFNLQNIMPAVLDDNDTLFQKGEAPEAAIYCGWYSLGKYVDAFEWVPGAIGFHIASGECISLKSENNQWCRNILKKGAAATLGPVAEPYVQAFPLPELFFKLLAEGGFTLVECYYLSLPSLS